MLRENNDRIWFLDAIKETVKSSKEHIMIHDIVDSISKRKDRTLLDTLAEIEKSYGWPTAVEYLVKAYTKEYIYNMGSGGIKVKLEPLKYREMIFGLFLCDGLEPVAIDTITLLEDLRTEKSLADATRKFAQKVEELAWNHIDNHDLLFFNPSHNNIWISDNLINHIIDSQKKEINNTILLKIDDKINVKSLWYCELGRQALTSICSHGLYISENQVLELLTVIQVSPSQNLRILDIAEYESKQPEIINPTHPDYELLLKALIEKDINILGKLGSKHSIPIFTCLLYDALNQYETENTSIAFQNVMNLILYHVTIRAIESILILEQLSQLEDRRISFIAITALGNFFHESAVYALINLVCNKRNNEVIEKALTSLENICIKNPETIPIIEETLKGDCIGYHKLRILHEQINNRNSYYK